MSSPANTWQSILSEHPEQTGKSQRHSFKCCTLHFKEVLLKKKKNLWRKFYINAFIARKLRTIQVFFIFFFSLYFPFSSQSKKSQMEEKNEKILAFFFFLNQTAALWRFHWLMWKKPTGVEHFLCRNKSNRHAASLRMCLINQLLHCVSLWRQSAALNGKWVNSQTVVSFFKQGFISNTTVLTECMD